MIEERRKDGWDEEGRNEGKMEERKDGRKEGRKEGRNVCAGCRHHAHLTHAHTHIQIYKYIYLHVRVAQFRWPAALPPSVRAHRT